MYGIYFELLCSVSLELINFRPQIQVYEEIEWLTKICYGRYEEKNEMITIRDTHINFWLKFNYFIFPFGICIFNLDANNIVHKLLDIKVCISEVFRVALLISFSSQTSAYEISSEF